MHPESPAVAQAQLHWDADGRPRSQRFDDIYFSRGSGLDETRFVFLQHNHLPQRWAALAPDSDFTIAETGFGTGLNFLAAWQLWAQTAPVSCRLHVVSVERYPLSHADLQRALALWPELAAWSQPLLAAYPAALSAGFHRLIFAGGRVTLTLLIDEASTGLAQLLNCQHPAFAQPRHRIDAWFLDGFAPAKNPEMWSDTLFGLMRQLSHSGTTAATFTCAGIVKRGLRSAGFTIEKVPGFGSKREMLRAQLTTPHTPPAASSFASGNFNSPYPAPWWAPAPPPARRGRTALIIGGGLAGCHSARALARRGWQVTLLEANPALAQEGSGNPQGVLYAKLSHRAEALGDFNLACLQFARQIYADHWDRAGSRCGVLQLGDDTHLQQQLLARLGPQQLLQQVDREQAAALAGVALPMGGLWFAADGWLEPAAVCRALLKHAAIAHQCQRRVAQLQRVDRQWRALGADGEVLAQADVAVICTANHARELAQTAHLPLKPVRGQITCVPVTSASAALRTVLCGEGYIAPAHAGQHCLGASFGPGQTDLQLRATDQAQNLQRLRELAPELAAGITDLPLNGRAALRATTPDYLPIVGPVANPAAMQEAFALLGKNARAAVHSGTCALPDLYVNVGHGSRGIAYTPLCAELLASQIHGDPPPLGWEFARIVHPARFLIRDIIRKRR